MRNVRVHKTDFTVIHNSVFKDPNLGLKARGLLGTMLSLPDNWDFSIQGLAVITHTGNKAIRSALHEIEKAGYLTRTQERDENGHFHYMYDVYDEKNGGAGDGLRHTAQRHTGLRHTANGMTVTAYNKESKSNTKELNTQELKTKDTIKGENEFFAHSRPESDEAIDVEVIDETPQVEHAQKDDYAQGDLQLEQEVVHIKPKTVERGKYSEEFEAFWKVYPVRRVKKKLAYEQWKKTIKTVSIETIMQGLKRVKQGDVTYMPEPMRWLRDGRWEDEPDYSGLMKNPALQRAQQNQQMANYIRQNAAQLEALDPWS